LLATLLLAVPTLTARAADGPGTGLPGLPDPPLNVEPVVRDDPPLSASSFSPWDVNQRPDREPLRASATNNGLLGSLTSQQTVRPGVSDTIWDSPFSKRGWQTDESWKLSVAGPVFVFGQASASAEDALQQDAHVNGKTGLGCQVPLPVGELLLKGGTNTTYSDVLRPTLVKERSELLLEVQGRCPLLLGIHLEFDGTACPALTPLERDWASQEVRLALPLGDYGKLKFGARHRWENLAEQKPSSEEVFLGLELKH
jgi:hypothetical protein